MIALLLDFGLAYISKVPTFFFLINILKVKKKDWGYLILISLVLDLFILNTYFLNTIIILGIFGVIKNINLNSYKFSSFLLLITLVYFSYIVLIGLINNYSLAYILNFGLKCYGYNLIFYIFSYKIEDGFIKLAR